MASSDMDKVSARSRSSTRLPVASSGGQAQNRLRSSSRQSGTRRTPSVEPRSRLADAGGKTDRSARPPSAVRAPSPATRGRMLQPHKLHLLQPHKPAAQANSRIPIRHPTPPLPGTGPMQEQAVKSINSQLPRSTHPNMQPPQSPARPPHTPLLPRMFSPSDPYLQGSKGLHERGLAALKEYRRLREERIQQAIRARQQQQIPQSSNGQLRYTIQQPPFLAGRPRTSSQPPNHHQMTPTRGSSRGRSGASQSPLSAARSPFSADRPRTSRRGSSVCSERRGTLTAAQRSSSGAVSNSSNTPPHHGANGDISAGASVNSSPAMQVAKGPVLKITPKVVPKLRTRTGDPRTDSQMHAEGSILQPQSPPSLRLQDQRTASPLDSAGGGPGVSVGMEDLLLQQVTALLAEKSNWTSEKQRLEKEVEQLHELIEYLFEQFNIPMDDSSVPLDGLTGLPQYLSASASDGNMPSSGSIQYAASAELPPANGGGSFASQAGAQGMMGPCNGNLMYHNSADLPSATRGNHSSADLSPHASHATPKSATNGHAFSGSIAEESSARAVDVSVPNSGPVAEADASFINMLCDGMMSASDAPHASSLAAENSASAAAVPLVVDGPRR